MKKELKEQTNRIKSMMEQIDDVTHRAFSNVETKEQYWDDDRGDAEDFERESLRNDDEGEYEYGDEPKVSVAGKWMVVEKNGSMYHVLLSVDPRETSVAVILDGDFNQLPSDQWGEFRDLVDNHSSEDENEFRR